MSKSQTQREKENINSAIKYGTRDSLDLLIESSRTVENLIFASHSDFSCRTFCVRCNREFNEISKYEFHVEFSSCWNKNVHV